MDYHEATELRKLAHEQTVKAKDYETCRIAHGKAKQAIDLLLAANYKKIRADKKNAGYETSLIMLMEDSQAARGFYKDMIENEAKYKSLEKILEAINAEISFNQSVMKYVKENT